MQNVRLWYQFYQRDISSRYLGSLSGLLWVFLHPALLLTLYTFLIAGVLKARIPELSDVQWVPYVALGLWPWMCFSEGLQRGTQAVIEHSSLLGKIALPAELLVAASVAATFSLHAIGLVAALLVLALFGYPIALAKLVLLPLLLICLLVFTLGIAWITACVHVYLRDVGQLLGQFLGFMFFLTPILYTPTMLPEAVRPVLHFNPISVYCMTAREWLLFDRWTLGTSQVIAVLIALAVAWIGLAVFRRLSKHFEDFL